MQKIKATKTFKEAYDQKNKIKAINECSWFCIVWGIFLSSAGAYQAVCAEGVLNIVYKIVALFGLFLLVVGCGSPLKIQKVIGIIKLVCSAFGNVVLKVILLPAYFAMTLVNSFRHKNYAAKFGFKNWEERHRADTAFCDCNHSGQSKYKNATLRTVVDVLSFFIDNRMYIVIPIIIILLIVGVVMFFVSSSAVFSFVYTLF